MDNFWEPYLKELRRALGQQMRDPVWLMHPQHATWVIGKRNNQAMVSENPQSNRWRLFNRDIILSDEVGRTVINMVERRDTE